MGLESLVWGGVFLHLFKSVVRYEIINTKLMEVMSDNMVPLAGNGVSLIYSYHSQAYFSFMK